MAAEKRVSPQVDGRDEATEGQVTVMADLTGGPQEVEVDSITPTAPRGVRKVIIRVNEDITDMSWVAENRPREVYSFKAGNRYEVPVYIAQELENLGKVWH